MTQKYICTMLFRYRQDITRDLLALALNKLGFEPAFMTVFFDEFEDPLEDVRYDEARLLSLLERVPGTITIKKQLYDEAGGNYWFRLRLSPEAIAGPPVCSLEWSNVNLDFLLGTSAIKSMLGLDGLIYCYCYDQLDNCGGEMEDNSEHWGKSASARGFTVMAAPLMSFGEEFAEIIPQHELLQFTKASIENLSGHELAHITLFDLYDSPAISANRQKQQEFWTFFDLQHRIDRYAKNHAINFEEVLKARAARKKKRK